MNSHIDYLPGFQLSFESGLKSFDVYPETDLDNITAETVSDDPGTMIAEKLDDLVYMEGNTYIAIWTLIGLISLIVVVRSLWTVFDKWFFGGV